MKRRNTIGFKNFQEVYEDVRSCLTALVKDAPLDMMDLVDQILENGLKVSFRVKHSHTVDRRQEKGKQY